MPGQIFISYRRDDAAYVTGHINDRLRKEFGEEAVFTDVDNIALGVDFRAVLDQTVSKCQVFLAVIGSEWLSTTDQDGRRRLDDPADFVRIEIESALNRDIPVIPLLVAGATMPAAEDLPESLRGLAFRNGTQIRPAPDFSIDMARLIKNLRRNFDPGYREHESADVDAQQETPSARNEVPDVGFQVAEDDRTRRQAELGAGHDDTKKHWVRRFGLVAVVVLVGASWYFVDRNQETLQAVQTAVESAILEPEQGLDAGDVAQADLAEDIDSVSEVEMGPPDMVESEPDTATEMSVDATDETAAVPDAIFGPEPEIELDAGENLAAEVMGETVDDVDVNLTASGDSEADTGAGDEVVATPETPPQPNADEFIGEGVRLAAIGDHEAAIQSFDEALELDVEQSFVYKQRGASYKALEQYAAAIKDYDEAIRLNNEDVNAYYSRGVSHSALQNYEAAIADFSVVIQFDPEFVDAYSRRADAHEAMGNADAAARDREALE